MFSDGVLVVNLRVPVADFDAGWHQIDCTLLSRQGVELAQSVADINIVPPRLAQLTADAPHRVRAWDPWVVRLWRGDQPRGAPLALSPHYYFLYNDATLHVKFMNSQLGAGTTATPAPGGPPVRLGPAHSSVPQDSELGRRMLAGSGVVVGSYLYHFYSTGEPWALPRGECEILLARALIDPSA